MNNQAAIKRPSLYSVFMTIGILIILFFGAVVSPFGGISEMGMKMLGVIIGTIFLYIFTDELFGASALCLLGIVFHGYMNANKLIQTWLGSQFVFMTIFVLVTTVAMSQSGAMKVIAKKLIASKIFLGHPSLTLFALFVIGYAVSIFMGGAPYYILFFALMVTIRDVCGYEKEDNIIRFLILGMYIAAQGVKFFPWKGGILTYSVANTIMDQFGLSMVDGIYMIVNLGIYISFFVVYIILMKLMKCDLSKLKNLDIQNSEELKAIPDKLNSDQKWILGILVATVIYIIIASVVPTTWPLYNKVFSFSPAMIWMFTATLCQIVRPRKNADKKGGKGFLDVPRIMSMVPFDMIVSLGAMTLMGNLTTDADLGIGAWLSNSLQPLFGSMGVIGLVCMTCTVTLFATQVINGNVLITALTPVIIPVACQMAANGQNVSPVVLATLINIAANVAYLTPAGTAAAGFLYGHEEMNQRFLITKGFVVLVVFDIWLCITGVFFNFIF